MSPNSHSSENVNQKLAQSIVHKPFATGKVNFLKPFKKKTAPLGTADSQSSFDDELETDTLFSDSPQLHSPSLESQPNRSLNLWSLSAIAIILLTNFVALGVMRVRTLEPDPVSEAQEKPTIGNSDLTAKEFMPLNLSTLSSLAANEEPQTAAEESNIIPDSLIPPAFVPFNNDTFLAQADGYHYVLAKFTGDRSLELAREKVTNISLVQLPQGMFIYLGAFLEEPPASEFVSKLQEEGIEAKIYPFE